MKPTLVLVVLLMAANCFAGQRIGGPYSANDIVDTSGGRAQSANALYKNDSSLGGIGGVSTATTAAMTAKHGYVGQLYDVIGLTLTASPTSVNEGQTLQLAAADLLDDATFLAVPPANITWSVLNGPIASVSTGGLATAAIVYQNTNASVGGIRASFSSSLQLSVLNVGVDDFGIYAGDGIDDDWQVQYFGENSPSGLATADPDGDGQNNRFEFTAGLVPNNPASRFLLRIEAVAGQPAQRRVIFSPRLTDRSYAPQFRTDLVSGTWEPLSGTVQNDNGTERTVTDLNAVGAAKFYRVLISRP